MHVDLVHGLYQEPFDQYGGPGGHASCQWLSRITPVLTPPTVVTSQCALRNVNATVLVVVVIPVQCPYRRLPYVSRRSFQFNVRTQRRLCTRHDDDSYGHVRCI